MFRLRQGVAQFVRWLRPYAHFRHPRICKQIQLTLNRARKEKKVSEFWQATLSASGSILSGGCFCWWGCRCLSEKARFYLSADNDLLRRTFLDHIV